MTAQVIRMMTAAVAGLVAFSPVTGNGAVYSVESFVESKSKWSGFAGARTSLRVEGRYSSIVRSVIRFRKCGLQFRPASEKGFSYRTRVSKVVEVTGRLKKRDGKLVFFVEHLRALPDDLETFRIRQAKIPAGQSQAWFDLGDWARGRGKFYGDRQLQQQSEAAYLKGILAERQRQPANNADGLFALAAKVARLKLPDALRSEILHEACQRLWRQSQNEKPAQLNELAERLARDLPGSQVPLKTPQTELFKAYQSDPLEVYRKSDNNVRRTLSRFFYHEVVLKLITGRAEPDGRNGFKIAAELDEQLSEEHQLAESFRTRELDFKLSHVAEYTRREALDLRQQFQFRKQPDKARKTISLWLQARTKHLRQHGADGLVRAANEYLDLLKDEEAAAKLLIEAFPKSSDTEAITEQLVRLGYQRKKGEWLSPKTLKTMPKDDVWEAMREGRVAVGMTTVQVQQTLGRPTSMIRIATAGHISEIWSYGEWGASRLSVHFERRNRRNSSEAKVVGIARTNAQ